MLLAPLSGAFCVCVIFFGQNIAKKKSKRKSWLDNIPSRTSGAAGARYDRSACDTGSISVLYI